MRTIKAHFKLVFYLKVASWFKFNSSWAVLSLLSQLRTCLTHDTGNTPTHPPTHTFTQPLLSDSLPVGTHAFGTPVRSLSCRCGQNHICGRCTIAMLPATLVQQPRAQCKIGHRVSGWVVPPPADSSARSRLTLHDKDSDFKLCIWRNHNTPRS